MVLLPGRTALTLRDPLQRVAAVHLMEMEASALTAGEEHIDQPSQDRCAIDVRRVGLQQVVHRRLRDWRRQDGECLHGLLSLRVEAAEGFPHECLHHVLRQDALGFGQHLFQRGAAIGGEDGLQCLERAWVA
jgi:hypothetical protein